MKSKDIMVLFCFGQRKDRVTDMAKTEFLYLSETDLIKAGVLNAAKCTDVCEEVFRLLHSGDYLMGGPNHNSHGLVIVFPEKPEFPNMPAAGPERRFIAMPTYLGGRFAVCGEKWYGSNVANIKERGLPRSVLMVTINDAETCEPLCYMSGNLISSMRTGCIPGVAVRYLANQDAETFVAIGTGPVQKATLKAMCSQLKNIKRVIAVAAHLESAQKFIEWAAEEEGIREGTAMESMEDALVLGDIVSIAASPKKPLYLKDEWIKKGATVLLTSPLNADDAFWMNNKIVFDNVKMHEAYYEEGASLGSVRKACNGWGQFYSLMEEGKTAPLKDCISLGDVVCDPELGRKMRDDKYMFVTSGQVVFDIGWGYQLYKEAMSRGLGIKLPVWEEPYWK